MLAVTVLALLCALAWLLLRGAPVPAAAPASAPAVTAMRDLRFAPGAPQLNFIKVEKVEALPEPLLDPLSARIAYDENHTLRLSSPIAGRVTRLAAEPGDRVAAGQLLLSLDAPEFAAAAADMAKAAADLRLKQRANTRAAELHEAGVIARKDFESAEADLRQSEAESARATQRLRNLSPGHAGAVYELRAPFAGVVSERNVNPGAEVRPESAAPLFVITDPSRLWVIVDVPERDLGAVFAGQDVAIEVDAYPDQRFEGRVAAIGEVLDPSTRRVQVRVTVDNAKRLLKPEMYARVTPLARKQYELPRIANSALITEGFYSFVFVEKETGVFARRQVELGLKGRNVSYVRSGLAAGERVVTVGAMLLNSELSGNE